MKSIFIYIFVAFLMCPLSACSGDNPDIPEVPSIPETPKLIPSVRLKFTAGETVLFADIFDNPTSRSFIEILPLTLNAFDRIGLVKSNVLPQQISDGGQRTRKYEKGIFFYWHEGPEVAICYSDHLPQTVVDIIHMGKIATGYEIFETYTGKLVIELERLSDDD
jgi:hypothetical protein